MFWVGIGCFILYSIETLFGRTEGADKYITKLLLSWMTIIFLSMSVLLAVDMLVNKDKVINAANARYDVLEGYIDSDLENLGYISNATKELVSMYNDKCKNDARGNGCSFVLVGPFIPVYEYKIFEIPEESQ